jgi:hypothetical protein
MTELFFIILAKKQKRKEYCFVLFKAMEEKIILTDEQIRDLYKENLLIINSEFTPNDGDNLNLKVEYKGGFQKMILWIHKEQDHAFLKNEDFEMLTKILEACKMTWEDIALVNTENSTLDYDMILHELQPVFLIDSSGNQNDYNMIEKGQLKILCTHPLSQIRNDKTLKIRLWQALKVFFDLN